MALDGGIDATCVAYRYICSTVNPPFLKCPAYRSGHNMNSTPLSQPILYNQQSLSPKVRSSPQTENISFHHRPRAVCGMGYCPNGELRRAI